VGAAPAPAEEPSAARRPLPALERGPVVHGAVIAAFLVVVMFVLPAITGSDWVKTYTSVAIYSVVALGLGILYGRVGMISLGQIGLLAIGTWTATRLNYAFHLPFPVLLLVTGAITCAVGVLVGLPALRLSGLYLALITLMFAGAVNIILTAINFPNGGGGFTGHTTSIDISGLAPVRRPAGAAGDTAYYRYVVVVCALMFLLALVHLAGKAGRAWASIRESEPSALAAGVNITLYKLWAFALASFMTGVAGCLLASQLGQPTIYGFPIPDSLILLAVVLIGGIFSMWGAVVAGVFMQLVPFIFQAEWKINTNFLLMIFGAGLLQVLLTAPGGLSDQVPKDLAKLWRLASSPLRRSEAA
jgi:branched-chain amino acid transport system permease protein